MCLYSLSFLLGSWSCMSLAFVVVTIPSRPGKLVPGALFASTLLIMKHVVYPRRRCMRMGR